MAAIPPVFMVAAAAAVTLGVPLGLYALLTAGRRRRTREIRAQANAQGWRYRKRRWQGNPIAFRIDGQTPGGLHWVMTCGNSNGNDSGWSVQLVLRIPALAGETDWAVLPRDRQSLPKAATPAAEGRIAAFSGALARATAFLRQARELPSGLPDFDQAYQVLALPRVTRPLIDRDLAGRILQWRQEPLPIHSVMAWRDPFAVRLQVRLTDPPDWATVLEFVGLADAWVPRLPAPVKSAEPLRAVDRLIDRFTR
jgi:hypothetical protein